MASELRYAVVTYVSLYDGNLRFFELTEILKLQKKLRAYEVDSEDIPRSNVSGYSPLLLLSYPLSFSDLLIPVFFWS